MVLRQSFVLIRVAVCCHYCIYLWINFTLQHRTIEMLGMGGLPGKRLFASWSLHAVAINSCCLHCSAYMLSWPLHAVAVNSCCLHSSAYMLRVGLRS